MLSIQEYRCGDNAILRENPGDRSACVGQAEGQIEQIRFFDPAMDSGGLKSQRCSDADVSWFHNEFSSRVTVEYAIIEEIG